MTNQTFYQRNYTSSARTTGATAKQLETYYAQCARKKVTPKDVSGFTFQEMSAELQRIFDLPLPASEPQVHALKTLLQELVDAGLPGVKMPGEAFFEKLTTESASAWIEKSRQLRAQNMDIMPASQQQVERLCEMYMFPDMNWESVTKTKTIQEDVWVTPEDGGESRLESRKITYTEESSIRTKVMMDEYVNGKQLWRFMTPDEFKEELLTKLTHAQASRLIDEHASAFEAWKRTRLTQGQYNQIRQIENRLANIYKPRVIVDASEDNPFDFGQEDSPFNVTSDTRQWNPVAYEPLSEEILSLFSREEADDYIRQLTYELRNPELRNIGGAQDLDYSDYGIEEARTAKDEATSRTHAFRDLNNFLYALSDITGNYFEVDGHNTESLRHEALQVFFNNASVEGQQRVHREIVDFVKLAIQKKALRFDALIRLADRSELASEIVEDMIMKMASL